MLPVRWLLMALRGETSAVADGRYRTNNGQSPVLCAIRSAAFDHSGHGYYSCAAFTRRPAPKRRARMASPALLVIECDHLKQPRCVVWRSATRMGVEFGPKQATT